MIFKSQEICDIIRCSKLFFKKRIVSNFSNEIDILLMELLGCSRSELYMNPKKKLNKSQQAMLQNWVLRRGAGEPLQYITQSCDFYGRKFYVTQNVFIPRPETERVVDIALDKLKNLDNPKILDICTGSGCIGSTLALELSGSKVLGIDKSLLALKIANENKIQLSIRNIDFVGMNILKNIPSDLFDSIVSNPPYIPIEEMSKLVKNVKDFEPHDALTDYKDGLSFYRVISNVAKSILKPKSWVILEVGNGKHPGIVKNIFNKSSFTNVELIKDYNGDNRVLVAQLNF